MHILFFTFAGNTTWSVFLLLELYMHNAEGINPEHWQVGKHWGCSCNNRGCTMAAKLLAWPSWKPEMLSALLHSKHSHSGVHLPLFRLQVFPENAVLIERSLNHCVRNHMKVQERKGGKKCMYRLMSHIAWFVE